MFRPLKYILLVTVSFYDPGSRHKILHLTTRFPHILINVLKVHFLKGKIILSNLVKCDAKVYEIQF